MWTLTLKLKGLIHLPIQCLNNLGKIVLKTLQYCLYDSLIGNIILNNSWISQNYNKNASPISQSCNNQQFCYRGWGGGAHGTQIYTNRKAVTTAAQYWCTGKRLFSSSPINIWSERERHVMPCNVMQLCYRSQHLP